MCPIQDDKGNWYCKGCDRNFSTKEATYKHEVECGDARNFMKNLAYKISGYFMKKHKFDRRLRLTKMFEYLYFRFVLDILAFIISVLVIIGRILAVYEVSGIPYSGMMDATSETIIILGFAIYIAMDRFYAIEEFYYIVIKQMPKFKSVKN